MKLRLVWEIRSYILTKYFCILFLVTIVICYAVFQLNVRVDSLDKFIKVNRTIQERVNDANNNTIKEEEATNNDTNIKNIIPNSNDLKLDNNLNAALVIVVQVHNREVYLKYFIESLRNAKDIESVLLIFSHDYIDEKINKLIANITFCKYMQIFYPYSTQLHPNVFPGPDEKDKETGRNATTMQMKHHWWWKVNKVFHFLSTTDYDGLVLLLEEDFYMVKDFIPTLKLMQETARKSCDSCELFSLALNEHSVNVDMAQENKANHIRKSNRISNMGISLTASSWKKIVSQKKCFCEYDDYNWDFTLQYLFSKCLNDADTMQLMYPRVIHIGACGAHFTSDNCDPVPIINKMRNKLKKVDELLFPGKLEEDRSVRSFYNSARNGGWNDRRDQELCLNMTNY